MPNIPQRKEPSAPGRIMASMWKNPVTELNFHPPYVEKLSVNVNVVDVMDGSCFIDCHTESVCDI